MEDGQHGVLDGNELPDRSHNAGTDAYFRAVIANADFDAEKPAISNEVEITERNEANNNWYVSWAQHEDKLIYACAGDCREGQSSGHIFECDLATRKISGNDGLEYRYPAIKGVVK